MVIRTLLLVSALALGACQNSDMSDATNVVDDAVAAVTGNDPAEICAASGNQDVLRSLLSSGIGLNVAEAMRYLTFSQTTVDKFDSAIDRVDCTTSLGVTGDDKNTVVRTRLSYAVQRSVDGEAIVSLTDKSQFQGALAAIYGAVLAQQAAAAAATPVEELVDPVPEPTPDANADPAELSNVEAAVENTGDVADEAADNAN